jgi:hypothetical protein
VQRAIWIIAPTSIHDEAMVMLSRGELHSGRPLAAFRFCMGIGAQRNSLAFSGATQTGLSEHFSLTLDLRCP